MYYTIYKTTNTVNDKYYIGKHQTENINDNYIGSGRVLEAAIRQYGRSSFKKEILFVFDNELEMNDKEREIITEEFVNLKNTYNIGIGGEGGSHFKGKKHSKETIEKLKKKRAEQIITEEAKLKLSNALKGRIFSEEHRNKLSEAAKNRTQEVRNAVSESVRQNWIKKKEIK